MHVYGFGHIGGLIVFVCLALVFGFRTGSAHNVIGHVQDGVRGRDGGAVHVAGQHCCSVPASLVGIGDEQSPSATWFHSEPPSIYPERERKTKRERKKESRHQDRGFLS